MTAQRGRPVVGAIAGLLLGVFLALDAVLLGLVPTNAAVLTVLPVLGLALGVAVGLTAPFGRFRRARPPAEAEAAAEAEATEPAQ
ncbi:MAG TPA: hypothetical protein VNU01_08785 [Egibacteraceae bacterium]|nr:hypothetical protein [Egibacteraceae bacterium]